MSNNARGNITDSLSNRSMRLNFIRGLFLGSEWPNVSVVFVSSIKWKIPSYDIVNIQLNGSF